MIHVSRLNGKEFVLNCEMIKLIEATPDTIITLSTGEKLMVRESVDQIIERTLEYRRQSFSQPPFTSRTSGASSDHNSKGTN